MNTTEKAYAKLNISLDVGALRPDGYHEMTMVMQTVSLCDRVEITETEKPGITAETNLSFIPSDERNLAVKAADAFLRAAGISVPGLCIRIDKKIPVGAGLAGGSADAAAVLRALNRLYGSPLSKEQLLQLAGTVGSDVPFCLTGGTVLATGRGEILQPVADMPRCCYCICKPRFSISTPELFRKLDGTKLRVHPDTPGLVAAVEQGNLKEICRRMYNVFEDVDDRRLRQVAELRSALLNCDALGAVMTGTGSAVYGVFPDTRSAERAAKELRTQVCFVNTAENVGSLL